jgi:Na+-driven multidrug efflux pump
MPGVIALVISKVLHPDISGRGYPLYAWKAFVFPLILNIILNFILIPIYGIYGAAISSTVSYVIGGVLYAYLYSKREKLFIRDLLIINKKDLEEIKFKMRQTLKKVRS